MQSGCCKPSDDCKFTNIEPRIWNKANGDFTNPDCQKWDNNPNSLCYNCLSCKAGMLDQIKGDWKKIAQINVTILVLLMILYIIGCCSSDGSTRTTPYANNAVYRQNPYHPQNPNCALPLPPNPYFAQNPNASKQMYP
ncbi:hypothetical protein Pint_14286 [Pistacia integerrima]|uniref:Uncharacterized protein n=1 Tax=Pistacia integerrima TaxID=434235 RepID=A0ACC0YAQ0_9ROSI|nr:hypothetical protein Pint_14286 [Pistacia integerrima]